MPREGQKLSEESIAQMKQSKIAKQQSKYQWDLIEPYMDVEMGISSRNRQRDSITLRQFKDMMESGMTVKDISKEASRNMVGFFSAFAQGKIELSQEQFTKEYNEGKSLEHLAEEHNVSKDYIGFLRQIYGLKVKGAKFQNRKATEKPMTQRQ